MSGLGAICQATTSQIKSCCTRKDYAAGLAKEVYKGIQDSGRREKYVDFTTVEQDYGAAGIGFSQHLIKCNRNEDIATMAQLVLAQVIIPVAQIALSTFKMQMENLADMQPELYPRRRHGYGHPHGA